MRERQFTDCVDIVGSSCKPFEGNRRYISTGAVATDHIDESDVEIVDHKSRPSRADLVVEPETLLFAKMQGTKKTLYVDKESAENIYSTGFFALKAKSGVISTRCLYHLLGSASFLTQKDKNCSGATQKAITNAGLKKIRVSIPDYQLQEAIADQLDKISSVIQMRRSELQKLDDLVKARFVEMFGDVIRNSKSWEIRVLADIASSRLGKMLDTKQQTGECSYPYLANFNVQWFRFNTENLNQMDFNEEDRIEFELQNDDLLVCEGGEIGRCAVWHNEIQPCFFQKALHRVRCNRQIVHPDYLGWWFKYNCDHDGFATIAGAKATIAHLPGVKLKQLRVAIPPLELQEQFAAFVNQIDKSKFVESIHVLKLIKEAIAKEVSHDRIR